MKYMGSKTKLLSNGLGDAIESYGRDARRIVDLFAGSAAVSWYAAEHLDKAVLAVDLQMYSVVLANSIIGRDSSLNTDELWDSWWQRARAILKEKSAWRRASTLSARELDSDGVVAARRLCAKERGQGLVWDAYGGFYFSPRQAAVLDALLATIPRSPSERAACLASLILAASRCAAAPGHTAQPFRPTESGVGAIRESWRVRPEAVCESRLRDIGFRHARVVGSAVVGDALAVASALRLDDLVVVDPPYSAVQYSRFYHVLETLARGWSGPVTGAGRYPPKNERPLSFYSWKGRARTEARALIRQLAASGCVVILTFPVEEASNGLRAQDWIDISDAYFQTRETHVSARFSTLGGNNDADHRESRHESSEALVVLEPRDRAARL